MTINFNSDLVGTFHALDAKRTAQRKLGLHYPTSLEEAWNSARCYLSTARVLGALASTDDGNDHVANICSGIIDTLGVNAVLAAIPDDWECGSGLGDVESKRDLAFNYLWTQLTQQADTSTDDFNTVAPLASIVHEYMHRLSVHLADHYEWNVDQVSPAELMDYGRKLTHIERWWLVELLETLDHNENTLDEVYAINCEDDEGDTAWRRWVDRDREFLSKLEQGHGYGQVLLYTVLCI